jgi:hypothetical protein
VSLYLTVFLDSKEIDGWVFGHYSDFGYFRDKVAQVCDPRSYPVLMRHSDCDGAWPLSDIPALQKELIAIASAFKRQPSEEPHGAFEHTREFREGAASLYDSFHTVDGFNVFEALLALCQIALRVEADILFQ